jgi:hypothetical protein
MWGEAGSLRFLEAGHGITPPCDLTVAGMEMGLVSRGRKVRCTCMRAEWAEGKPWRRRRGNFVPTVNMEMETFSQWRPSSCVVTIDRYGFLS